MAVAVKEKTGRIAADVGALPARDDFVTAGFKALGTRCRLMFVPWTWTSTHFQLTRYSVPPG